MTLSFVVFNLLRSLVHVLLLRGYQPLDRSALCIFIWEMLLLQTVYKYLQFCILNDVDNEMDQPNFLFVRLSCFSLFIWLVHFILYTNFCKLLLNVAFLYLYTIYCFILLVHRSTHWCIATSENLEEESYNK